MSEQPKFEDYRMTHKLGEGTFSEVLKVKHKMNGKVFAMKRFRKRFNSTFEEIQNLREIQALKRLNPHSHVIQLIEVLFDQKHGVLALNFELMDCNLYELISKKNSIMTEQKAKNYFFQICKGLDYMHSKGIFHRDIKPENILIKDNTIKLADFGSCRGIHSKQPYTEYIATRWYRSPECLLCDGIYTFKMDLWGAGCVLYEIITKAPLFPGSNELDQLHRIHGVVGTPSQKLLKKMLGSKGITPEYNFSPKEGTGLRALLPNISTEGLDLLNSLLVYDPDFRITARDALKHTFFKEYYEEKSRISVGRKEIQHVKQEKDIPNPSYLKKAEEEKPAPKLIEEIAEKRKSVHLQEQEDTQSVVSTNSTSNQSNIYTKKQVYEQHYPIGIGSNRLRRTKQKEYSYKNVSQTKVTQFNKLASFKKEQEKNLPLLIDTTKNVKRKDTKKVTIVNQEYVTLPALPSHEPKQEHVNLGISVSHGTTLPSIHREK